jgi:two-component system nitrogen regulation sensor histidine kinase NtrY
MHFKGRFALAVGGYLALLVAAVVTLAWVAPLPGLYATKALLLLVALIFLALLWSRTQRTNLAIGRFISAIEHGDLTQNFRQAGQGAGFDALGAALDSALNRLREERARDASENRFAAALVDEAPTPLLAIDPDGIVRLSNKRARQLFGGSDGRRLGEFGVYGAGFLVALGNIEPGERRMCRIDIGGLSERAMLACAGVSRSSEQWRIVAVQVIQRELDAAEIATQSDLVRILTHEIMNSITPVTSLAATAATLMASIDTGRDAAIGDARMAVEALSRRATGIMHFVDSYREFSMAPSITLTEFAVQPWLDQIGRLFAAMPHADGVELVLSVVPQPLTMTADAELLAQVLLNLLKNGAESALAHSDAPRITASVTKISQGRCKIVVADNGPGIPENIVGDVFLPFFTTKRIGTGVGLSFARQIVLLHAGSIEAKTSLEGGAAFELMI